MTVRIGFVGLGAMGLPMAMNLVAAGFAVQGFDLSSEARAKLAEAGGIDVSSALNAAEGADILILMVVDAAQAASVLFDTGVADTLAAGAIVALMSTCPPKEVATLAGRIEATGRRFVDAPVSGGVAGARSGTLTIMAAAPNDVLSAVRPVFEALGKRVFHVGTEPGQGAGMKSVNQLLCGVHLAAAAEALSFAERMGIDAATALEILGGSAAASWMLTDRGPRMLDTDPVVTSAVDIFVKDLGIVLDASRDARAPLPLAAAAHQMFLAASGAGDGKVDDSQVIQIYRAMVSRR